MEVIDEFDSILAAKATIIIKVLTMVGLFRNSRFRGMAKMTILKNQVVIAIMKVAVIMPKN